MKFSVFLKILSLTDTDGSYFVLKALMQTCLFVFISSLIAIFLGFGLGMILYCNYYKKTLLQKIIYSTIFFFIHVLTTLPFVCFSFFVLVILKKLIFSQITNHKTLFSYICLTFFLTLIFTKQCSKIWKKIFTKINYKKNIKKEKMDLSYQIKNDITYKVNVLINNGFAYAIIISSYLEDRYIGHLFYNSLKYLIQGENNLNTTFNKINIHCSALNLTNENFLFVIFIVMLIIIQIIYLLTNFIISKKIFANKS
ncbi:MAG: hypothetical protein Q8784_01480 [Vigna little leaf phytoplasma]|nr:hypothetical protein [Vigna little leaf phytoplasma]